MDPLTHKLAKDSASISTLAISIVNHSNPELLRECIRSIFRHTQIPFEIWVVDNATDGRLVDEIRREFPAVIWLFNDRRRGFSDNHNQVLSQATARYVCILNDDTVVHADAFDQLVQYAEKNQSVGMIGPRLLNVDGSVQNSAFYFMTFASEAADICVLPRSLCRWKQTGIHPAQNGVAPAEVEWLLGACIVVRRRTIEQIGMLDGRLSPIANTEEVDWCYRAREQGWAIILLPAAVVTHIGGQSMKADRSGPPTADAFRVELYRTRIAFFEKHYGWTRTLLFRLLYVVTLPFNLMMLAQGWLRGRLSSWELRRFAATLFRVALIAILPRRSRHCRRARE